MGIICVCVFVFEKLVVIVNVGDFRVYVINSR